MTLRQLAVRNVLRNKRRYAGYFVSSAFSVMVFFVCALFLYHPVIAGETVYSRAEDVMLIAEAIVYVFSFLFVAVSVGSFLQSRRKEFAILAMQGMTKRELNRMVLLENMMIGAGAILTGTAAGLILGKLFLMIGAAFLGIGELPFHLSWHAPVLTIASFAVLFPLISVSTFRLFGGETPQLRHNAGEYGKEVPDAALAPSLAAVLLLGAGYWLAATVKASAVEKWMIPVVAITVAGSYLFYTRLSLYLVKLLRSRRRLYWRPANLLAFSALAYRWQSNGRMLFMVTIVSAVSFTSVGVFASVHTLSRDLMLDYPAAVGYVAKDGADPEETEGHLQLIAGELDARGLAYSELSFAIKQVAVAGQSGPDRTPLLPVMAYSDYVRALEAAGFGPDPARPQDGEALVMIGSQRDRSLTADRAKVTYRLADGSSIAETGYTAHVPVAEYLLPELDGESGGDFSGVVVSDGLYASLRAEGSDGYTGYYTAPGSDFLQTVGIAAELAETGKRSYEQPGSYALVVSGTLFESQRLLLSAMLFASLLVGTVFFIAAGSFLYFRLYVDLDDARRQYATLSRLGLTDKEMDRSMTIQLALLFFVPIALAAMHSLFAFMALQRLFYLSIATETGLVLITFFAAQSLYFLFIRSRYLRNLRKSPAG